MLHGKKEKEIEGKGGEEMEGGVVEFYAMLCGTSVLTSTQFG